MNVQPAAGAASGRSTARRPSTAERAEECAATQARLKQEAAARRGAAAASAAPARPVEEAGRPS